MAMVVQKLAQSALKDSAAKNFNGTDPYWEQVPVHDKHGRPTGKLKKQRRHIPLGLSKNDEDILKRVRSRAYHLDMSLFNCCGIRFGWSSVIGMLPVVGDFVDCLMAYMVVQKCGQIDGGLPQILRARMLFNIMLDFGIGLVPILGDLADALFRANTRNAWLLEAYLTKKAEEKAKEKKKAEREGQVSDPEHGHITMPTAPQAARTQLAGVQMGSAAPGRFGSGKVRQTDEEMGVISDNRGVTNYDRDAQRSQHPQRPQHPQYHQGQRR